MLDEARGRSNLRLPLSWLQFAACAETVGFRPQLHATAAIAAQTGLLLPSFDKQKGRELKSRPIIRSLFLSDLLPRLSRLTHLRQATFNQ